MKTDVLNRAMNLVNPIVVKTAVLILFALASFQAAAATITVQLDRNPVEVNESFAINFTAKEAVDGQPDFRPLEDSFKVLNRNQSSNIQIINGRMSRQTQWTVFVMPKHAGKLLIPSIAFGDDRSPPMQVTVNDVKAQSSDKSTGVLFLENEADKTSVYVQAQIVYTVRIYQAINLVNATLSDLSLSDTDAIVEKIDDDTSYDKTVNGRRFKVFEKHYIIFPQKSGTLTINPAELQAQYVDTRRALRTKVLQSDPITIEVKPKPMVQTVQNNAWLPAKQLQLKEEWPQEPPVFKVGEPITRTITIVADGLSAAQLPEIKMAQVADMKQYPDQPAKDDQKSIQGIIGTRQEKIALIPTKTGSYVIPGVEIPWWNTEKDRLEYLRLPQRTITVQPGAQTAQQDTQAPLAAAPMDASVAQNTASDTATKKETPSEGEAIGTQPGGVASFWMWVSLIAIFGWLITALAWWRKGNGTLSKADSKQHFSSAPSLNAKQYIKALKTACDQHNAQAAKSALLHWGKSMWPERSPGNLNELGRVTGGALGEQLLALNKNLYSNNKTSWDGATLWMAFSRFEKPADSPKASADALLPLYKTIA